MRGIAGKVGEWEVRWLTLPRGPQGRATVEIQGSTQLSEQFEVEWRKDVDGIWIELPTAVFGFDIQGELTDESVVRYRIARRGGSEHYTGLAFVRCGEEFAVGGGSQKKKSLRIKAQMPGKIVRILVKEGSVVEKGDSLLVIEAMKMENQIRALHGGIVKRIAVSEGETVETGAELIIMDSN